MLDQYNNRSSSTPSALSYADSEAVVVVTVDQKPQPALRTLDSVRNQVAREIAFRTISRATTLDGVRIGIADASSASPTDESFFHLISDALTSSLPLNHHLFLIPATVTSHTPGSPGILIITSSSSELTNRAVLLASAKFTGRVLTSTYTSSDPSSSPIEQKQWLCLIKELNVSSLDTAILEDTLKKAARTPFDPSLPPPGSRGIDQILEDTRAKLQRITPRQALTELRDSPTGAPTFLVDIRPRTQREEEGTIKGALIIERNNLEWKFDPRNDARLPIADRFDLRIIVFCQEGDASSLAAYSLQQIGMLNATDIVGGFNAWRESSLPIEPSRQRSLASLAGSIV